MILASKGMSPLPLGYDVFDILAIASNLEHRIPLERLSGAIRHSSLLRPMHAVAL